MFRFLTRWFIRHPRYEFQIVIGSSYLNVDEAAREAQLRVAALAPAGWEAISIGTGGRAAAGGGGAAEGGSAEIGGGTVVALSTDVQIIDVTVLMRRRL